MCLLNKWLYKDWVIMGCRQGIMDRCVRVCVCVVVYVHLCMDVFVCLHLFYTGIFDCVCWYLQFLVFWSGCQLSSSSHVGYSVEYLQLVFSALCSGTVRCSCVCLCEREIKTVCLSLIRSSCFNQETCKDKRRCESPFSFICSEAQKHPLLCPQHLP